MEPLALSGNWRIAAGVILGIVIGFAMVRSQITWRKSVLNMFKLEDCRFINVLFFSGSAGILLFYFLHRYGVVSIQFRPGFFWASVIGGIITGCGLIICGHIPVSALASLASGRIYSAWVLVGMLIAMPLVKVVSRYLADTLYRWDAPLRFCEKLDGYTSMGTVILWIPSLLLISSLFLEFTIGNKD